MEPFYLYLLKSSFAMGIFYLFYMAVLKKDTFLHLRRWYFGITLFFALCLSGNTDWLFDKSSRMVFRFWQSKGSCRRYGYSREGRFAGYSFGARILFRSLLAKPCRMDFLDRGILFSLSVGVAAALYLSDEVAKPPMCSFSNGSLLHR